MATVDKNFSYNEVRLIDGGGSLFFLFCSQRRVFNYSNIVSNTLAHPVCAEQIQCIQPQKPYSQNKQIV